MTSSGRKGGAVAEPVPVTNTRRVVQCRGCQADIFFAITEADRAIPLNREKVRVAVLEADGKHVRFYEGYVPHHITCPNADEFRKPKT